MKSIFTLILFFIFLPLSSQTTIAGFENRSPFTPEGVCDCRCDRPWMSPESEMDALKKEIWQFENKLSQESKDSSIDFSAEYIKIYQTEYVHRIEFDGRVNEQFCVKRDHSALQLNDSLALTGKLKSFGGKFLKKTAVHFYLGNAQITTYFTEYFIKKE